MVPFIFVGPGDFIREEIEARGLTTQDLVNIIDLPMAECDRLLKNERPIDLSVAERLSVAFGQSIQFWINQEKLYRKNLNE